MNKPGILFYKCRRCNGISDSLHTPNVLQTLIFTMNDIDLPEQWAGIPVDKTDIHNCEDGGIGISDLIGGKIDEEERK